MQYSLWKEGKENEKDDSGTSVFCSHVFSIIFESCWNDRRRQLEWQNQTCMDSFVPENSSMVSYGKLCNCGGVNYLLSTSYGKWVNASEEKCTSHTYGTDIIQTRSAAKTYRCSSCLKGYVEHLMETKRVCHGYDY